MWNNISKYLDKFYKIPEPGNFYNARIVEILKEDFCFNLNENDIDCRWGSIYIKTNNNLLKNEIFINKNKILETISNKIKFSKFKEIRF